LKSELISRQRSSTRPGNNRQPRTDQGFSIDCRRQWLTIPVVRLGPCHMVAISQGLNVFDRTLCGPRHGCCWSSSGRRVVVEGKFGTFDNDDLWLVLGCAAVTPLKVGHWEYRSANEQSRPDSVHTIYSIRLRLNNRKYARKLRT
jgi:hypothetical protein